MPGRVCIFMAFFHTCISYQWVCKVSQPTILDIRESEFENWKNQDFTQATFRITTFLNCKKTSRRRIIAAIKSFYRFLDKSDINIDSHILTELKGPKIDQALPRPIKVEEIKNIFLRAERAFFQKPGLCGFGEIKIKIK